MLPTLYARIWLLPLLCLMGIGTSYLLLKGVSVKRKIRPRLPLLATAVGIAGGMIGWAACWISLDPFMLRWGEEHLTPLIPPRLIYIPITIVGAGPGFAAGWIIQRTFKWRTGAADALGVEIMVVQYLVALTVFLFAYILTAATP